MESSFRENLLFEEIRVKTTVITDRDGAIVLIGRGPTQGAADQDARVQLREQVKKSGEPWGSHKWLKEA